VQGDVWAVQNFRTQPQRELGGWELEGAELIGFDDARGLRLRLTEENARIRTPEFCCGTIVAPFVRLE
jgi:hypothetical protein